ncbi:MAG: insulinase family protein [Oscillospiraceae bacterium]|nr:insulinase family protein [Oscillospiraceae bacterium]
MITSYPRVGDNVYRSTLPGGLRVITVPKPGFKKKYAFIAFSFGGMDCTWDENGVLAGCPEGTAHYLEHRKFETAKGSADLLLAAEGAQANAFTSEDMTAYLMECSDNFEKSLAILLSFVSEDYFPPEGVERERGIITQEIDMCFDDPWWCAGRALVEGLYSSHPLLNSTVGTRQTIEGVDADVLRHCYRSHYTLDNAVLCVVGDVEPSMVEEVAVKHLRLGAKSAKKLRNAEGGSITKSAELALPLSNPIFELGFKAEPPAMGAEHMRRGFLCELACESILGGSSPLYSKLYAQGLINSSFSVYGELSPGACYCAARGESENADKVTQLILDEVQRIAREGFDEKHFARQKKASFGARLRSLNSFENTAWDLCDGAFSNCDYFEFPEVYESITASEAADFIARTFTPERMCLVKVTPLKGE